MGPKNSTLLGSCTSVGGKLILKADLTNTPILLLFNLFRGFFIGKFYYIDLWRRFGSVNIVSIVLFQYLPNLHYPPALFLVLWVLGVAVF